MDLSFPAVAARTTTRHPRTRDRGRGTVIETLTELDQGPFSFWVAEKHGPRPTQAELEPYVARIKRHAVFIDDDLARDAAELAASVTYSYLTLSDQIRGERPATIWHHVRTEAEACLGAYVRGELVLEPSYLREAAADLRGHFDDLAAAEEDWRREEAERKKRERGG